MDQVKDAFHKVKEDIDSIRREVDSLRSSIHETRDHLISVCEVIKKLDEKVSASLDKKEDQISKKELSLPASYTSTHIPEKQTTSTHTSTHNTPFKPLNTQNLGISTGNEGVSTDRQTDRQTHQQTDNKAKIKENSIDNAAKMLDSLDSLKKDIRLKFKRLTDQELLVFSTMYQLDDEIGHSDYKTVAERINLTESSVRDYVGRLIKKGIPVDKTKINNKSIQLSISPNLKKVASLPTILQLREL